MSERSYQAWEFDEDLDDLVTQPGTTLATLNERFLRVTDPASPTAYLDQDVRDLAMRWTQRRDFVFVRLAELFHGVQLVHDDDYVLAAVGHLGGRTDTGGVRRFMLRHDEYLREHVFWRFFEVEGGGEVSLANVDKFSNGNHTWTETILALVTDGVLDRSRILRSCLEALNRDFSAYRAGWFSRLHDALAPDAAEARANQGDLLRLLASTNSATTALAVRQAHLLHKAGTLDAEGFIRHASPAMAAPKTSALKVLAILRSLAGPGPDVDTSGLFAAAQLGMSHPHHDVQRAATSLLADFARDDLLAAGYPGLSPAVATEFGERLHPEALPGTSETVESPAGAMLAQAPEPPRWPHSMPVPGWPESEVLEHFASLLERPDDPIAFELALSWLAAHDASELLRPLARRAAKLGEGNENVVADLVLAATGPGFAFRPPTRARRARDLHGPALSWPEDGSIIPVLYKRVREVVEILQARAGHLELLATPTSTGGWIDPGTLVQRFLANDAAGAKTLQHDTVAALLRIAPEGRHLALELLQGSTLGPANTEAGSAIAYVLGGPPAAIKNASWWVAAARARAPFESDNHLLAAGLDTPGQGHPAMLSLNWKSNTSSFEENGRARNYTWWRVASVAGPHGPASAEFPSIIPSATKLFADATALEIRQVAMAFPPSTLPLAASSIVTLNAGIDTPSPAAEDAVLEAMDIHPGRWEEPTAQILALALSAKRPEARIRATELFARAIPQRFGIEPFAAAMAHCARACILSRWATSLADAAGISASSAEATREVLAHLLPRLEHNHHGVGKLLQVYLEESIRAGTPPASVALREWLEGFSGSSIAARHAKRLLAM